MIRPRLIALGVLLVFGGSAWSPSAFAQPRYYPRSGAVSPWMSMFQRNPGPLDNYHSYVQPQIQLQNTLGQQNAALQQQSTRLQSLGQQLSESEQEGPIHPTGAGSVFMNYSHYYTTKGGNMGVRSRSASHATMPPSSGTRYAR
jgi:hypothetical protein